MKTKKIYNKKSFSYVTYKKNYPRTLNTFSKYDSWIIIVYDKVKKAWKFVCVNSFSRLCNDERLVYNPAHANRMLCNTTAICEAIDGVFEYKQYAPIIKLFAQNLEEKKVINETEVISNNFFQEDEIKIKQALKTELETSLFKIFTHTTISKIYNSIKNRIKYKLIYCNKNGEYDNYESSQLNEFGLCRSEYHLKDYTAIRQLIQQYHEIYKKYAWIAFLYETYEYYLNTEPEPEDDPITFEWRAQYNFLIKNGIFQSLYESVEFFYYYMSPFYNNNYVPIDLLKKNKKTYMKYFRNYIKKHLTEESLKSIGITHMANIYKILMEEIPKKDWENIFFIMNTWPEWYGKVLSKMNDKTIELKQDLVKYDKQHPPIPF